MNLRTAKSLARKEFKIHGLTNWAFNWDNAKRRCGVCKYYKKEITISRHITRLNSEEQFRNTLLHEIAHAMIGPGYGHNSVWKNKARSIGCSGERTAKHENLAMPKGKYTYACPKCGIQQERQRKIRRKTACGKCCNEHNFGRWTADFELVMVKK